MHKTRPPIRPSEQIKSQLRAKGAKRRSDLLELHQAGAGKLRNDLLPRLELVYRSPDELVLPQRNVRAVEPTHVREVMNSITSTRFVDPVLIDETNNAIDGVVRVQAALQLGLPALPCILARDLTGPEKRVVRLALNRLSEKGRWDFTALKAELIELVDLGIEIEDTAFTLPEFDQIVLDGDLDAVEPGPLVPLQGARPVSQVGDTFSLRQRHRVTCGDATDPQAYAALMRDELARLLLTDQPYNVPIAGHVTKGHHRAFVQGSGELTDEDFLKFTSEWLSAALPYLFDGGLLGTFIDWRGYPIVHSAAMGHRLTPMNLIAWVKQNAGMGSFYRSAHELFPLFKKGSAPHTNNIALGKNGRWRSNVWYYPGASSINSDSRKGLQLHPTVKPVAMCADALLDLTNRDDIVLDPFLGSGSTIIAAEKVGRRCFGIELDPLYVDVLIRRYLEVCKGPVTLEATGESFEQLETRRHQRGL